MSESDQQQAIIDILSNNDDDDDAKISTLAELVDIGATSTVKIINVLSSNSTPLKKKFISYMIEKTRKVQNTINNNNNINVNINANTTNNNANDAEVTNKNTTTKDIIIPSLVGGSAVNNNKTTSALHQRIVSAIPLFVHSGMLTTIVKTAEQKRKEVWAETVYNAVLASVDEEIGDASAVLSTPFPLTDKKVAIFVRACSHLGYTFGSVRNSLIPALKRIQIDRYGVDVELDATKSMIMKQAYAYCKVHAEDDEAGEGNPFTMYDWKYVSSTLPQDSPEYWRDSLILFFPLMTAARCVTLGHFRDKDFVTLEACGSGSGDGNSNNIIINDNNDSVIVGGVANRGFKLVLNLKVTKNDANWNKKMIIFGQLDRHDNWQEDLLYILNQYIIERSGINIQQLINCIKRGEVNGDRLLLANNNRESTLSSDNVAALMNNLRHVFTHRTYMAGYPERFFHFHDARAGFLSTIIIKNNINNETGNSLLYKAAILGGWTPNGRSINLYFRKAARHQLSPTSLLTDNLVPLYYTKHTPESFHHLQYKLVARWKTSTLYDYFQSFIKRLLITRRSGGANNNSSSSSDNNINNSSSNNSSDADGLYVELCRRLLIQYTDWDKLVDENDELRKGVLNDGGVLKAFSLFFQSTTLAEQRKEIRECMVTKMEEWMKGYHHREGRPSVAEETRYLQLIREEKKKINSVITTVARNKGRKREVVVEFASVFPTLPVSPVTLTGNKRAIEEIIDVTLDDIEDVKDNDDDKRDHNEDDKECALDIVTAGEGDDDMDDIEDCSGRGGDEGGEDVDCVGEDRNNNRDWYDIEEIRRQNILQQKVLLEELGLLKNTVQLPSSQKQRKSKIVYKKHKEGSVITPRTTRRANVYNGDNSDSKKEEEEEDEEDEEEEDVTINVDMPVWRTGVWNVEEDILLKELAVKYERKWSEMEANRGSLDRSQTQMKDRMRQIEKEYLPEKQKWAPNHGKWSANEDELLTQLMEKYNKKWSLMEIHREGLNRNQHQMKDRWRQIEKEKQRGQY